MIRTLERFEFKYWVPESTALAVVEFARPWMVPDLQAGEAIQRNTSIYLDSPQLDFWRQHIDGAPDRFKLRIRRYGTPPQGPAFFELKRKVKTVTRKRRVAIPMAEAGPLIDGTWKKLPRLERADDETLQAFLYQLAVYRAVPQVAVACERQALKAQSPLDDARLTLDRDIVYQRCEHTDFGALDPRAWVAIDTEREHGARGHRVMVELKFGNVAPGWMEELCARLALYRCSYSKYVAAVRYETQVRYRSAEHSQVPNGFLIPGLAR